MGLNAFQSASPKVPVMRVDSALEEAQVARVRAVRAGRDAGGCDAALGRLEAAASGDENLVPLILAAVKAEATVGEISDRLRAVFGEHQETLTI